MLTLTGCDVHDERVGYSSKGPSIAGMRRQKPDLTAYTHFLGSKVYHGFLPDEHVRGLRGRGGLHRGASRKHTRKAFRQGALFQALKDTAYKVTGPNWDPGYGHGIIRPVEAFSAPRLDIAELSFTTTNGPDRGDGLFILWQGWRKLAVRDRLHGQARRR